MLSRDEKSQIQSLSRTQPDLPMKHGHADTMIHNYQRNGTTTLITALNTLDGVVISMCHYRHWHEEWLKFLRLNDCKTSKHLHLHVMVDNYATHKHLAVREWLDKHPLFVLHKMSTNASLLNMVERFFRDISENRLRCDSFASVDYLEQAIVQYIEHHNPNLKPFIWTARVADILAKVTRGKRRADLGRAKNAEQIGAPH